jgi:hypothetical protein
LNWVIERWPVLRKESMNMNTKWKRLEAEFRPEIRFEVEPAASAPFRVAQENHFERLRGRLLADRLKLTWGARSVSQLRRAANEAAALAWVTPYPLLVFPVLFEEKAEHALLLLDRQQRVKERSRELMMI